MKKTTVFCLSAFALAALAKESKAQETTISIAQNNGYFIPYGPKPGGDVGTQVTISKNGAFLWGAYDHKNKKWQEIDVGYGTTLFARDLETMSISLDGEGNLWYYPPESDVGTTTDFVIKCIGKISTNKIFGKNNKTTFKSGLYHLIDNDSTKNGSGYDFELSQEFNFDNVNLRAVASRIYGAGLYGFKGYLNTRVGIDGSITCKNVTFTGKITHQFKGKNQPSINNATIAEVGLTYVLPGK